MQLSMAIAMGRMLLRPWSSESGKVVYGGADSGCVMMLAAAAANGNRDHWIHADWSWLYAYSNKAILPCACEKGFGSGMCLNSRASLESDYLNAVIHLFNDHVVMRKDWTLDQLIDWVRSVEPSLQETPQQTQPQDVPVTATVPA